MEFVVDAVRDGKQRVVKGFAPKVRNKFFDRAPPTYFENRNNIPPIGDGTLVIRCCALLRRYPVYEFR